jgi:hypothetical protein
MMPGVGSNLALIAQIITSVQGVTMKKPDQKKLQENLQNRLKKPLCIDCKKNPVHRDGCRCEPCSDERALDVWEASLW